MKKVNTIFFAIILFFALTTVSYSDSSFELIENEETVNELNPFIGEVDASFDFKNTSKATKNVVPSILIDKIASNHEVAICIFFCYPYTTTDWTTEDVVEIPSDNKLSDVIGYLPTAHCKPNGTEGQTKVRFRFADKDVPADFIDIPVTFNFGTTSVDDVKPNEFVVAYPNPTNGVLSVYSETLNIDNLKIFDLSGKEMLSQNVANNYKTLDLSLLAKGKYIMFINFADGTKKTQSVIIE